MKKLHKQLSSILAALLLTASVIPLGSVLGEGAGLVEAYADEPAYPLEAPDAPDESDGQLIGEAAQGEPEAALAPLAASACDFYVSGLYDYNEAAAVLSQLNSLRTSRGLPALVMDKKLSDAAMQRAAELSIYFSHTRPNGSSYSTILEGGYTAYGENAAMGQTNATNVMASWRGSQGHLDNMVHSSYNIVGIGCFYQANGTKCWIQLFGRSTTITPTSETGVKTQTVKITALDSNLSLSLSPTSIGIQPGGNAEIALYNTNIVFTTRIKLNPSYCQSMNTSIATVDANGQVRGVSPGTVVVRIGVASNCYKEATITVVLLSVTKDQFTYSLTSKTYNGSAQGITVTPKAGAGSVTAIYYNGSASAPTNAGTYTVTINASAGSLYSAATNLSLGSYTISPASISSATVAPIADQQLTGFAITPALSVTFSGKTLVSGTDYTVVYSNNVNTGTATATISGRGNYTGTKSVTFKITASEPMVRYRTHVQNVGDQAFVTNGTVSGTSGRALRLEGIWIELLGSSGGSIEYRTHIQNIGWQSWKANGAMSGTSGQALRLEAIQIRLTGNMAANYDVYYRVHAQNVGWMGWAKNGEAAGTAGHALRLEAIQVCLVDKGAPAPPLSYKGASAAAGVPCMIDPGVITLGANYDGAVHIQNIGDTSYPSAGGATILGTQGRGLRLEALSLSLRNAPYTGGITYEAHVQNIGWQGARSNGGRAGTQGQALRLEAVRISLTGNMGANYDVYYRTHIQNIGWTGWAKNGQSCGSAGYAYRMEAVQIVIVPKGSPAPGLNSGYFYQK